MLVCRWILLAASFLQLLIAVVKSAHEKDEALGVARVIGAGLGCALSVALLWGAGALPWQA